MLVKLVTGSGPQRKDQKQDHSYLLKLLALELVVVNHACSTHTGILVHGSCLDIIINSYLVTLVTATTESYSPCPI